MRTGALVPAMGAIPPLPRFAVAGGTGSASGAERDAAGKGEDDAAGFQRRLDLVGCLLGGSQRAVLGLDSLDRRQGHPGQLGQFVLVHPQ